MCEEKGDGGGGGENPCGRLTDSFTRKSEGVLLLLLLLRRRSGGGSVCACTSDFLSRTRSPSDHAH